MKNSIRLVFLLMLVVVTSIGLLAQKAGSKMASVTAGENLVVVAPATLSKGLEFFVDVTLAVCPTDLLGVSFDFTYTSTAVIDYVLTDTAGTVFGGDILYINTGDDKNGKVGIGLSKKKPSGPVSGTGIIARIKLKTTLSASTGTVVTFALSNVKATDSSGAVITITKAADSAAIAKGNIVWPGDTDSSGVVSQADLLPIGFHWLRTGAKRTGGTTTWSAQAATPWSVAKAVYADANGDSTVNQADVLVIGLNWGKIATAGSWSVRPLEPQFSVAGTVGGTPMLRPVAPSSISPGSEFSVDIVVGDQLNTVSSLFGISYVLDFASSKNALQVLDVTPGSFLGSDIIFFPQTDNNGGTVSFGITRKAGQAGVSGTGAVARVKFRLLSPTPGAEFRTRDIVANNQYGYAIQVIPANASTLVSVDDGSVLPTECALLQNYPNPFNPTTAISYRLSRKSLVTLNVLDVLGREVATLVNEMREPGVHTVQWNASNLPSGTYVGLLKSGLFTESRRMILLK